ncbi:hypothetical protein PMAYCL1PPCAC_33059, partial [Pristionchus mayeri]
QALNGDNSIKRRRREFQYAMQFAVVAAFHCIAWLTFRIFPPLVNNPSYIWLKGITTLFALLNSSTSAFLFLLNNTEVR